MTDLVAAVRSRLQDTGSYDLPSLTREELVVLGDDPVLRHSHDELWWAGLDERAQQLVRETALRSLIAHQLLVVDSDGDLALSEDVHIVLQARRGPSVVVMAREPTEQPGGVVEDDRPRPELSILGIDLVEGERSAFVLCGHVAAIASHRLAAPALAAEALTSFLLHPPADGEPVVGRAVEVLRPGVDGTAEVSRALLVTDGRGAHLSQLDATGTPGPGVQLEPGQVHTWVRELLAVGPGDAGGGPSSSH